jgi:pyruvate carboxylase
MCYIGDVSDFERGPYTKEYYLNLARQIVETMEVDILCIKDMAGLLTPQAATELIGALREEFPSLPIHVHTHDTSGVGVSAMRNALLAGADVVDSCSDAMSGMTSQPSMGALVKSLQGTSCDTGLSLENINRIGDFWEETRQVYAPFESGQKSGSSDVFVNEIPGGQYTNLLFQSQQLGLAGEWSNIKRAYAAANDVLGDIIKVTPSSKVVGDLAQFMVQNKLTKEQVIEQAEELSFPQSVVEYFQGYIGIPPFGFPEPLRTRVLKGKKMEDGRVSFEGRPGAELHPYDFEGERAKLQERWGEDQIREVDLMSHALYPAVFEKFMESREQYHDLGVLDTRTFANGLSVGEEVEIEIAKGKTLLVLLKSVSNEIDEEGFREVTFELNGRTRRMRVHDKTASVDIVSRPRALAGIKGSIGAPMPGVVVGVKVKPGDHVSGGDPIAVLSAMKMETVVTTPVSGTVTEVVVGEGDNLKPGDLIITVTEDVEEEK